MPLSCESSLDDAIRANGCCPVRDRLPRDAERNVPQRLAGPQERSASAVSAPGHRPGRAEIEYEEPALRYSATYSLNNRSSTFLSTFAKPAACNASTIVSGGTHERIVSQ